VRLALELRPDVVLMGLRMPDVSGGDAIRVIVERGPGARVVILAVAATDADVAGAIAAGACGFLAKDTPIEGILGATRAASEGGAWLSPRAAEVVLGRLRQAGRVAASADLSATVDLSAREREVLRLLARGMDNAENRSGAADQPAHSQEPRVEHSPQARGPKPGSSSDVRCPCCSGVGASDCRVKQACAETRATSPSTSRTRKTCGAVDMGAAAIAAIGVLVAPPKPPYASRPAPPPSRPTAPLRRAA
jgi:CheY-like chemotaxis protein